MTSMATGLRYTFSLAILVLLKCVTFVPAEHWCLVQEQPYADLSLCLCLLYKRLPAPSHGSSKVPLFGQGKKHLHSFNTFGKGKCIILLHTRNFWHCHFANRGDYGRGIAFVGILLRLFYSLPGRAEDNSKLSFTNTATFFYSSALFRID